MTYLQTALRAALLGIACLAGPFAAAHASAPLSSEAAWTHLEEMEKQGVQRDPFWAQAFWTQAMRSQDPDDRAEELRWALRFDPELTAARWELCRLYLRNRDEEFAQQALLAGRQAVHSFLAQQRIAVWVLTVGGGALLVGFVLVALITIARTVPRLHHGVWERLLFLPRELRWGAALLTVLLPVAVAITLPPTAVVLWLLVLGTVGAWPFLETPARRACIVALVLVVTAPAGLAMWTRLAQPSQPGSYLRTLWAAQTTADPDGSFRPSRVPAPALKDAAYHASLALTARRAHRYEEAVEHLERAIELDPDRWVYHNNLGNALLLAGDVDDALDVYAIAARLAPKQPLVHVNEAQAWMRKLRFTRADEALEEAARLGYHLPRVLNTGPSDIIVRDRGLDAAQLWIRFAQGHRGTDELSWGRVAQMTLAPIVPLRPVWLSLTLLLALHFASRSRTLPRSHFCAGCGRPICRKCHYRVLRRSLCAECNAIRREVRAPLKREELLLRRRRRIVRWPRLLGFLVSLLLPGAGYLFVGAPRRAVFALVTGIALLLIAGAGTIWPDSPTTLPADRGTWSVWIPIALYTLMAIASARTYARFKDRSQIVGLSEARSS
jgi:tetratricopeptide (TPR) repeat protein